MYRTIFIVFLSGACYALTVTKQNVKTTFSKNVKYAEDSASVRPHIATVKISGGEQNFSVTLDRNTGFQVKVDLFDLDVQPSYVTRNRTGSSDNTFYRGHPAIPDWSDNMNKYCNYPIPSSYNVKTKNITVRSQLNTLTCKSLNEYSDRRYGCPLSRGYLIRAYNSSCCCSSSCAKPYIAPFPDLTNSSTLVCVDQSKRESTCDPSSACNSLYNNFKTCMQDLDNNPNSTVSDIPTCLNPKTAYENCVNNYCPSCGSSSCTEGQVTQISLEPVFSPDQINCDIEYFVPNHIFQVNYSLWYNGTLQAKATGFSSKPKTGPLDFFQSGVSTFSNFLSISHNILLQNPLQNSYLLNRNSTGDFTACEFIRDSVDVVNTDMWSQYTYSTPIQSYAPTGLAVSWSDFPVNLENLIDPYGYFYERYQQYKDPASIFYFDWQNLINSNDTNVKKQFLQHGFSSNCYIAKPIFKPFSVRPNCIDVRWTANNTYQIPIEIKNNYTVEVTFLENASVFAMLGTASEVDIETVMASIDIYQVNTTLNTTSNSTTTNNGTQITHRFVVRDLSAQNSTFPNGTSQNGTSQNTTVQVGQYWMNASMSAALTRCESQYLSVGLQIDGVKLVEYSILVQKGVNDSCPMIFTLEFIFPTNMTDADIANLTQGQTLNVAIVLSTAGQPYYIYPQLDYIPIAYIFGYPTNGDSYSLSAADKRRITDGIVGLSVMIFVWFLFFIYFHETKDRKKWQEVTFRQHPGKYVCYFIQDHMPDMNKKNTKGGYFVNQQHMIAVVFLTLLGIIKAVTFSATVLFLIYVWINEPNFNTLSQFPGFYSQVQSQIVNTTTTILIYGENELARQQADATYQIERCNNRTAALKLYVAGEQASITLQMETNLENCSTTDMMSSFSELQVLQNNQKYNKHLEDLKGYYQRIQSDYNTARKYVNFAVDIADAVCDIPIVEMLCPDFNFPYMPSTAPSPPEPEEPSQITIPSITNPPKVSPAPAKSTSSKTFFNSWNAPKISIPVPDFNINFDFAVDIGIQLRNVAVTLDIIFIIRRIMRTLQNAALLLLGIDEEEEAKQKLYTKDYKAVNLLRKEIEDQKKTKAASGLAKVIISISDAAGKIMGVMQSHPTLGFIIQNIFLIAFVISLLVLIVIFIYVVLSPNLLEGMGLMTLLVQPIRVQLATTNTAIVQQAYFLNTKVLYASEKKSDSDKLQIEVDVNLFNAQQINLVIQHNLQYSVLKESITSLGQTGTLDFCNPLNATQVEVNYGDYDCHYTTIEARVYTDFHPDDFQAQLTLVFNVYVQAFRDATIVTVACIGGFVGVFILTQILMKLIYVMLKKFNAVKVNRKRWYVEVEQEVDDDDEDDEQKQAIKKLLKKCELFYGDEFLMRFRKVLDSIKSLRGEFHDTKVSQLRAEIEARTKNDPSANPKSLDRLESKFEKLRMNLVSTLKKEPSMSRIPTSDNSSSIEKRREAIENQRKEEQEKKKPRTLVVQEENLSASGGSDVSITSSSGSVAPLTKEKSKEKKEKNEKKEKKEKKEKEASKTEEKKKVEEREVRSLSDKLYDLRLLALQSEELFQWASHDFTDIIDEVTLRARIQFVQQLPFSPAVSKNLATLELHIYNLLDQFRLRGSMSMQTMDVELNTV